ncbi:MAG TPA: hypothetical protein VHL57_11620 [Flavobacteriales bacterium]|nr:hypothetical protein [Flavobacteriales bacterium]
MRLSRIVTLLALVLLLSEARAQDEFVKGQIRLYIDRLFDQGAKQLPKDVNAWMFPTYVGDGTVEGWRGPATNGTCGALASAFAQCGQDTAAISWLCAGLRNTHAYARDLVKSYPRYALDYVMGSHRADGVMLIGVAAMPPAEEGTALIAHWFETNQPQAKPAPVNFASF